MPYIAEPEAIWKHIKTRIVVSMPWVERNKAAKKETRSHSTAGKMQILVVTASFDHKYSHFKVKGK